MKKRFKRVYIEITNVCNLRCSFCPVTKRTPKFMSTDEFEKILIQIKPYTDYVYLHVKGEPLLHPELGTILDLCEKYALLANITTNGTLLKDKVDVLIGDKSNEKRDCFVPRNDNVRKCLRQINISLHSFEDGGEEKFTEYINGIFDAVRKIIKQTDTNISFRLWNQNAESKHKVMDKVFLNFNRQFEWPDINRDIINKTGTCHGLRDQVAILVDGTVVPCCLDNEGDINLGNVFMQNFDEIISSKRACCIEKGFREHKLTENLCMRCGYIRKFEK